MSMDRCLTAALAVTPLAWWNDEYVWKGWDFSRNPFLALPKPLIKLWLVEQC
jgi:hypothetical protein